MNEILSAKDGFAKEVGEAGIETVKELPKWFNKNETLGEIDNFEKADRPLHELGKEGTAIHDVIQAKEIEKGNYSQKEVPCKNAEGIEVKRSYEFTRGPRIGEIKEQGTRYDLYNEDDKIINTAEIKPYTESGIKAAKEKYEMQKDLEENHGGNKGKEINRESIFYNPSNGEIIERFETNQKNLNNELEKYRRDNV